MSTITERALLVDLRIHAWGGTKTDKDATEKVAEEFEAKKSAGSYSKRLLPSEAFREIYRVWNVIINEHNRRTLPWADSGARVISSDAWFDYNKVIRKLKEDWSAAVDNFCENYKDSMMDQKSVLGKMFDETDYPSEKVVRQKFGLDMRIMPIPTGNDFRVDLDDADELREAIDAQTKAATEQAMKELADRISGAVSHMVGVLVKADVKSNVLRDSLVDNLRTLARLLPGMNLTQDPVIKEVAEEIEKKLCTFDGSSLRSDAKARETTKKDAEKILEKMKDFYAVPA